MTTILLTNDYFFWSKVDGTAKALGRQAVLARSFADVESSVAAGTVQKVILDLRHPEAMTTIAHCAKQNIPTLGFVSHMDQNTIMAARNAGCNSVIPKSQFSMNLAEILQ